MAALEIEGKIRQKLAKQTGQSAKGAWTKQDFVVEYQDGNYPAEVCFTAFGNDKVADLDKYQTGDSVKVAFNLRAREYNGRWYNDVRVWRLSPAGQEAPQSARQPQQSYGRLHSQAMAPNLRRLRLRQSTTCRRTILTTTCRSKNE